MVASPHESHHPNPTALTVSTTMMPRYRTFWEKQPYIVTYGAVISLVSPLATAYQLCQLYRVQPMSDVIHKTSTVTSASTTTNMRSLGRLAAPIIPQQIILKVLQMNASTPVKESMNPWLAFAVVGVLQGGVYGHANVYFSRVLGITTGTRTTGSSSTHQSSTAVASWPSSANHMGTRINMITTSPKLNTVTNIMNSLIRNDVSRGMSTTAMVGGHYFQWMRFFRGAGFAGCRDTISQGIPFVCSESVRYYLFDQWSTTGSTRIGYHEHPTVVDGYRSQWNHWFSVLLTSVVSTYASQGLHNCQIAMQADPGLRYGSAIQCVYRKHGWRGLVKGAEARVGLLLVVNVLNELLLKPAWAPIMDR